MNLRREESEKTTGEMERKKLREKEGMFNNSKNFKIRNYNLNLS
jgi:hypothetical protein